MIRKILLVACRGMACVVPQLAAAQQALWQVPSPPSDRYYGFIDQFVDYNGDGRRDLLQTTILNYSSPTGPTQVAFEVASGLDGSILLSRVVPVLQKASYVGDMTGDGQPEIALLTLALWPNTGRTLSIMSLPSETILWQHSGPYTSFYGWTVLGNIDLNGDGDKDLITLTRDSNDSRVFTYDNSGAPGYVLQMSGIHGVAVSLANMGDRDGDGGEDFLVGVNEGLYGKILLVSGRTGTILRTSWGLQAGDKTCDFVSNVGDMDGDGVPDYAGFPWITGASSVVVYSGQTGQVIRTWPEFGNSVITGEDVDQDGVADIVIGADWQVTAFPPHSYGSTRAYSGRDGQRLWEVANLPVVTGPLGSNSGYGWMEHSASLGVQPGSPYPVVAWFDQNWFVVGANGGRIRGFRTDFGGGSVVTGTACSTTSQRPLIGVRTTPPTVPSTFARHTRITVAKGPAGGAAWLNMDYASAQSFAGVPLPIDLTPYGLPGCQMFVGPTASVFRPLGTTGNDRGYAQVELPRPLGIASLGTPLVAQWVVFDPSTLAYGATQKHQFRIQ